ncbi:nitroreductase family protein [Chloroflexota bacterium]
MATFQPQDIRLRVKTELCVYRSERRETMDVTEAIVKRKSIRGYKPDPVPKEVLREILEIASRSPSANNTQPWEVVVITGEVLENIKRGNAEMEASGIAPHPYVGRAAFEGIYKQRQVDVAIQLYELMGIAREDREKRAHWEQRGRHYFDAPVALILYIDKSLKGPLSILDIGSFIHAICLTAWSYGLGTCVMNQAVFYPEVVSKFAHLPESKHLIIGISIGYPDWDFPANKIQTTRESVENFVTWHGFD